MFINAANCVLFIRSLNETLMFCLKPLLISLAILQNIYSLKNYFLNYSDLDSSFRCSPFGMTGNLFLER